MEAQLGLPVVPEVTVKASVDGPLDGRGRETPGPGSVPRELTSQEGFKTATGYGHIAAHEALGKQTVDGLDFVRPGRFRTR